MFARRRRTWRLLVLALVAILACAAGIAVALLTDEPGDVSNPDVEFRADEAPQTAPAEQTERRHDDFFTWPVYGGTFQRTHFFPMKEPLRPPFRTRWAVHTKVLLEFPPVAGRRDLYLLKDDGGLYAIDRRSGRIRWRRKLGSLAASSPAYANGTVYAVILERGRDIEEGRAVALSAGTGRTRWSRRLPSRAESSPVYSKGVVYFGTEDGTVYALRSTTGEVKWTYKAGGAVKGGLALDDGRLYFGAYGGTVHAIRASDGKRIWQASSAGRGLRGSGNFYSTPAVAYGRVYIGNTDSYVYSFAASDGQLAWRKKTGGFVYSSPAVAYETVFVGSYDRKLYALDARTGAVRWERRTFGRVSGGPSIIGDVVYASSLEKATDAFGVRTGRKVWSIRRGKFNPGISDGKRFYFVGATSLFAFEPKSLGKRARDRRRDRAEKRAAARRRAQRKRYLRFRFGLHGHRHVRGKDGEIPRCHLHRHVYRVEGERRVLKHDHCHKHVPDRRGQR